MLAFCINQSDKYLLCGVIDFTIPKVKNILNALIIKVVFSIIWEDNSATSLITCKKKTKLILYYLSTYLPIWSMITPKTFIKCWECQIENRVVKKQKIAKLTNQLQVHLKWLPMGLSYMVDSFENNNTTTMIKISKQFTSSSHLTIANINKTSHTLSFYVKL